MSESWKPQAYLVGAGPGDPGLLTRRGEALLKRADIVFHDALIHPRLLDLIPDSARRIPVGKRTGGIGAKQPDINRQMIAAVREGHTIVRLKGGDPFVFGRGGEEVLALAEAGIRFEIVPGVTSASAVPAMVGIPVTLRGTSSVLHIVTGHEDPADRESQVNWDLLTQPGHTVVVLMGSAHLIEILQRLRQSGMDESTPLAVIHWGTLSRQRSLRGTLAHALTHPDRYRMPSPALAVIGDVAGMDESLNWFEQRPLFGRHLILTRPEGRADAMMEALSELGAEVENIPMIRTDPSVCDSDSLLVERLDQLRKADGWLVLPSDTAIENFFLALERMKCDARALSGIQIAVLSPKAARKLAGFGMRADFVPDRAEGVRLAETLPVGGLSPQVLVAGSSLSRPEMREALERRSIPTRHHVLYSTLLNPEGIGQFIERLTSGDAVEPIFFSPSAVGALTESLKKENRTIPAGTPLWAIGSTTGQAMREAQISPTGEADSPTVDGLVRMLTDRRLHTPASKSREPSASAG